MHALRRRLRPFVALALVAMAALVLLPTLAHAFAKAGSAGFVEVCTPQGMKLVALEAGEQAPDGVSTHLEHCPWCAPGGGHAAAPPPVPAAFVPAPAAGTTHPPRFLHAPRTPHAWTAAHPRGPPALG